jgi:hypothetical protein
MAGLQSHLWSAWEKLPDQCRRLSQQVVLDLNLFRLAMRASADKIPPLHHAIAFRKKDLLPTAGSAVVGAWGRADCHGEVRLILIALSGAIFGITRI